MGLSFAIPIEVAMDVVEQLKRKGYVSRGWLGVYIQEVTRELAESFGMKKPSGALVANVLPNSPAEKADIRVGDVIMKFEEQDVTNSGALPPMVGRTAVGERVTLRVIREGKMMSIKLEVGELPEEESPVLAQGGETTTKDTILGLEAKPLTPQQRKELEIESGGIVITRVHDGPAKESGIREGDVLQMINNQKISDVEHFKKLVEKLPKGKFASVLVQRSQGPEFVAIKVPG